MNGKTTELSGGIIGLWLNEVARPISLHDHPSPEMLPLQRFVTDTVMWEESLPYVIVTAKMPRNENEDALPSPPRGILKPYHKRLIRYDVMGYDPDPDNRDRGRLRFPDLRTDVRRSKGRTASPPLRLDDPDGIGIIERMTSP